jgi:hypothetical protein
MVMAVYEYPTFATSGFSLIFFLLLGVLWFIPVALCAAEMATVEGWEKAAFLPGCRTRWVSGGALPRSLYYFQIAIDSSRMLYFILGALSYVLAWPALNNDPLVKTIALLVIMWFLAFTQLGGTKYTARIAKAGFLEASCFRQASGCAGDSSPCQRCQARN